MVDDISRAKALLGWSSSVRMSDALMGFLGVQAAGVEPGTRFSREAVEDVLGRYGESVNLVSYVLSWCEDASFVREIGCASRDQTIIRGCERNSLLDESERREIHERGKFVASKTTSELWGSPSNRSAACYHRTVVGPRPGLLRLSGHPLSELEVERGRARGRINKISEAHMGEVIEREVAKALVEGLGVLSDEERCEVLDELWATSLLKKDWWLVRACLEAHYHRDRGGLKVWCDKPEELLDKVGDRGQEILIDFLRDEAKHGFCEGLSGAILVRAMGKAREADIETILGWAKKSSNYWIKDEAVQFVVDNPEWWALAGRAKLTKGQFSSLLERGFNAREAVGLAIRSHEPRECLEMLLTGHAPDGCIGEQEIDEICGMLDDPSFKDLLISHFSLTSMAELVLGGLVTNNGRLEAPEWLIDKMGELRIGDFISASDIGVLESRLEREELSHDYVKRVMINLNGVFDKMIKSGMGVKMVGKMVCEELLSSGELDLVLSQLEAGAASSVEKISAVTRVLSKEQRQSAPHGGADWLG